MNETQKSGFNRAFATLVALTAFMELFDGTVIQTALPAMSRDFGTDAATASIAMAGYFAAVAGVIPICAWFADRIGVRRAFVLGITLFTVASLLCGTSSTLSELLIFRILQGVGGAVMLTVGQLAVLRSAPKELMLKITAYLIWPALAAPVIAPLAGGLITDTVGWRWLFWVNVPIGIGCGIAGWLSAPKVQVTDGKTRLDLVGAVTLGLGLTLLVPALGMIDAGAAPVRLLAIGVGLAAVAAATLWMLRNASPLLNLRLFSLATYRAGNLAGAVYRGVVAAAPVLLTLLFQLGFGWSASAAGLMVMALFAGNIGAKPFANYSVRRWGFRAIVIWPSLIGAGTLVAIGFLAPHTPVWLILPLLFIHGACRSIGFTAYTSLQYADVPKESMVTASPLSSVVAQLATALGIAVFMALLSLLQSSSSTEAAFAPTFWVMAAVLAISAISAARLPRDVGADLAKA